MNKKLLGLVVAVFATTAQADNYDYSRHYTPATEFPEAKAIAAKAELFSKNPTYMQYKIDKGAGLLALQQAEVMANLEHNNRVLVMREKQAAFERQVQTAMFATMGAIVATMWTGVMIEWYQEFKVRKAEKAKLIAKLNAETAQVR